MSRVSDLEQVNQFVSRVSDLEQVKPIREQDKKDKLRDTEE